MSRPSSIEQARLQSAAPHNRVFPIVVDVCDARALAVRAQEPEGGVLPDDQADAGAAASAASWSATFCSYRLINAVAAARISVARLASPHPSAPSPYT